MISQISWQELTDEELEHVYDLVLRERQRR
jgi:hypothetical protein